MGVSLSAQAGSLAYSLLLGAAAALLYDLLRAVRLRRRSRALTALFDALYCLVLAALCFLFTLKVGGGELRLYMLFGALAGAALYFSFLSALFRPLWDFWTETLSALLRLFYLPIRYGKIFYGKLAKLCKRLFLFSPSCLIMKSYERSARLARRKKARKEDSYGSRKEKTRQPSHRRGDRSAPRARGRAASSDAEQNQGRRG